MKTLRYFIEFLFIKFFFLLFKIIGYKNSSNLGGKIGSFIGPLFRSKSLTKSNIQNSLPNLSQEQIEVLIKKMWENYVRIFSEYMFIEKFRSNKLEKYLNINGIKFGKNKKKWKASSFYIRTF